MTNPKQTQRAQQTNHNSKQLHAKGTENARVQGKICKFWFSSVASSNKKNSTTESMVSMNIIHYQLTTGGYLYK